MMNFAAIWMWAIIGVTLTSGKYHMSDTEDVCDLCHRGTEVTNICGHLYVADSAKAHKRCMQYSAGLIQYHSNIGFGGFKLKEVKNEIDRGSKLKCHICSNVRSQKKTKLPTRGATSGCALSNCRKSFHYYCAYQDAETITCRMEVVGTRKKKVKFVEYRVFCSEKHHQAYIASKDKENQRVRKKNEESGSSDEELYGIEPVVKDLDEDEDFETDSSTDSENNVTSTVKVNKRVSTLKKRKESRASTVKVNKRVATLKKRKESSGSTTELDDVKTEKNSRKRKRETSLSDSDTTLPPEVAQPETKQRKLESPFKLQDTVTTTEDSSNGSHVNCIGTLTPVKKNERKSDDDEISPIKVDLNPETDCLLCFVEVEEISQNLEKKLKRLIKKIYNIPASSVCIWRRPDFQFTAEHTVYMLKDLTMALRQQQYTEFQRLVLHLQNEDINKYTYIIDLNATSYHEELSEMLYAKLRESIKENLTVASEHLSVLAGWYCRVVHMDEQIRVAFLTLSDDSDPGRKIRNTFLKHIKLFKWEKTTQIRPSEIEINNSSRELEYNALKQALAVFEGTFVDVKPWDPIMVGNQKNSVTVQLLKHFQMITSKSVFKDLSSRLIFVRPLDGTFIVFSSYLQKMMSTLFLDKSEQSIIIVCDIQADLLTEAHILQGVPAGISSQVLTAFNPQTHPVSCLVVKLQRARITDNTVSSTTVLCDTEATEPEALDPEPDGNQLDMSSEVPDADDGIDMCEIIREDPPTESITFTPPDLKWRLLMCNSLGLKVTSVSSPNTILETRMIGIPSQTHKIKGDGNCFFRALSQELTGSQHQHAQVRKKLINFMSKHPKMFNKFFNMSDVKEYIEDKQMALCGTWATDTEIIAMASMLETNIVIFTKVGTCYKWLPYSPVSSAAKHDCQVYLVNKGHHYDLVLNVLAEQKK